MIRDILNPIKVALLITVFLTLSGTWGCLRVEEEEYLSLAGTWKFFQGDDTLFKNPDFDDGNWKEVIVPKKLETQGVKEFTGIGWYRKSIVIPKNFSKQTLGIYFSNISDSDEIYINGDLIGNSGSFLPNGKITPHYSKTYRIIERVVNFDAPNQISVRFNKVYGPFIGIYNQAPLIGEYSSLLEKSDNENVFKSNLIFIAAILILVIGLYHLILYLFVTTRKDYLLFFLACFFISIFETFLSFWPYSHLNNLLLLSKIHVIAMILGIIFQFLFVLQYFDVSNKKMRSISVLLSAAFFPFIVFAKSTSSILVLLNLYFVLGGFLFFTMLYFSIQNVIVRKFKGNLFMPLGIFLLILATISDALVTLGVYYFNFINAYGFFVFIIGVTISLAIDYGKTTRSEQLKTITIGNIRRTASELTKERNLKKLLENSIAALKTQLNLARCTIALASPDGDFNDKADIYGDALKEPLSEIDDLISNDESGPFVIKDVEDTFSGAREGIGKKHRQMMIAPMLQVNKRIGLIILSKKIEGINFTGDDKEFVTIIADALAVAVENAIAFAEKEGQIRKQRDALLMSEKMAAIGQLTSGIGHEINNPINFIISYVPPVKDNVEVLIEVLKLYEEMNNSEVLPDDRREEIHERIAQIKKKEKLETKLPRILRSLDAITDGAKRVASIVDSLKAYARADTLPVEIDINEAIDKSLIILTNKLKNRVEIKKDYETNVKAKCYFSINQVIVNLLSNAADAISEKGEIEIKTQSLRDKIRFSIKDTGDGMTEEVKKKLFTPFFTTKGPGKGTGLGLSISYNIIYDQHHGSIDIQSESGKGSTFTVTIPKNIAT